MNNNAQALIIAQKMTEQLGPNWESDLIDRISDMTPCSLHKNGLAIVFHSIRNDKEFYHCLIRDNKDENFSGAQKWTTKQFFDKPTEAFDNELISMKKYFTEKMKIVESLY
jgi:hypothetical protein